MNDLKRKMDCFLLDIDKKICEAQCCGVLDCAVKLANVLIKSALNGGGQSQKLVDRSQP